MEPGRLHFSSASMGGRTGIGVMRAPVELHCERQQEAASNDDALLGQWGQECHCSGSGLVYSGRDRIGRQIPRSIRLKSSKIVGNPPCAGGAGNVGKQ